jgi:lipoprotein signal peptidase
VIALDLSSKLWARAHLAPAGREHPAVGFAVVHNHGAALVIGSGQPGLVGAVEVLGVLVVVWWLWSASSAGQRACAAVVLGGAAGNLFDRLRHGAVTDWIHIAPYPPYFNVADLAIRGGLAAALVLALCRYRNGNEPSRAVGRVGPIGKRRGADAAEVSGHCKDSKRPGDRSR